MSSYQYLKEQFAQPYASQLMLGPAERAFILRLLDQYLENDMLSQMDRAFATGIRDSISFAKPTRNRVA